MTLLHIDISRAYFHAPAKADKYIEIPAEDWADDGSDWDMCGKLNVSLYGARDAAGNWEESYAEELRNMGFVRGKASPCLFTHSGRALRVLVHGDDFVCAGPTAHLRSYI